MTGELAIALGIVFLVNLLPLMTVPLLPLTAAFFAGRLVSYSIYGIAANLAERSVGDVVVNALTSPVGLVLQVAMLGALGVLLGGVRPGESPRGRLWGSPDGRPRSSS